MKTIRLPLMLGLAAALPAGLFAKIEQSIALCATTRPDYVRPADAAGKPLPQSYVFFPGRFFNGNTSDHSLEHVTFDEIARTLAPNLARQSFFPTKDAVGADLTIVVHWGATDVYRDPLKQFNTEDLNTAVAGYNASIAATGMADVGPINQAITSMTMAGENTASAINYNATLLGYVGNLMQERRNPVPSTLEITLNNELNEERYFVILMAYDNHAGRKEHVPRLLWVTRLSVRSPGNNFTESLPAMSQIGGQVFGRNLGGLAHVKASWRGGEVTYGEMKVLGVTDADLRNK